MEIKLDVYITDYETNIGFEDNQINIKALDDSNLNFNISKSTLYFLLNENCVRYIGQITDNFLQKDQNLDKVISITVPSEVNLEYLEYAFTQEAIKNGIILVNKKTLTEFKISDNQKSDTNEYKDKILFILKNFGYDLFKLESKDKPANKTQPTKARHKWTKEISQIKFTAKLKGGVGEAIWQNKDKLVLLSGAKLVIEPQMNKDGTINYSAQFAEKLRLDHADKIINNVTTVDIVFPSPNQLGIFLFYGGQNTWAELKDSNGKSLDEWSIIE